MRHLSFGLLAAALLAAALWSLHAPERRAAPVPRAAGTATSHHHTRQKAPAPTEAATTARRFVSAFLSYEVGDHDLAVRRTLRADASATFAHQLLRQPRRAGPGPLSVNLQAFGVHRLPRHPGLILVSGAAARQSGPEPFAFLFARRAGRWLAIAPAE